MTTSQTSSEWGRELKVSELKVPSVVIVMKEASATAATMWVVEVTDSHVFFTTGEFSVGFAARREGERITDNVGADLAIYEYLGEI